MQRRLNYTGRQRIQQDDMVFSIMKVDERGLERFVADINLEKYELPKDAKVWVEAYDRNSFMRFPYGSVENTEKESDTTLTVFAGTDSYSFRVKIVDDKEHARLHAVANNISPVRHEEDTGKSLLRVTTRDLGPVPWELEYTVSDHPLLVINNQIDAGKSLARSNQFFQALVFPAIVEQILRHILLEERYQPTAEPDSDDMWKEGWLEFAGTLPGNTRLPTDQEISNEVLDEWIEDARRSFCKELNSIRKVRLELREIEQ